MKKIILIFLTLSVFSVRSQEVISSQGETYSNASGSVDFTIGEVVINTVSDGSNDLTQGFHQTNWKFVGLEDFAPQVQVSVFPNPVAHVLNIKTEQHENVQFELFDESGKLIYSNVLTAVTTQFDTKNLHSGIYTLVLKTEIGKLKSFSLVKIN